MFKNGNTVVKYLILKKMAEVSFSIKDVTVSDNQEQPSLLLEKLSVSGALSIIATYLIDQIHDKAGFPKVEWISLYNWKYDHTSKRGKFRLSFHIKRTFYCSDIESSQKDYIDINFIYSDKVLKGYGQYVNWEINN